MPAAKSSRSEDSQTTAEAETGAETEAPPTNPLEALRRAQASRSLPPGSQQHGGGKAGGRGATPKAPRKYNRHK